MYVIIEHESVCMYVCMYSCLLVRVEARRVRSAHLARCCGENPADPTERFVVECKKMKFAMNCMYVCISNT